MVPAFDGPIALRPARAADSEILRVWRNDPVARSMSLHGGLVDSATHSRWFAASLASPDRDIMIALVGETRIGMCRFDRLSTTTVEVSVNVDPLSRGRGLAADILRSGILRTAARTDATTLRAHIRQTNAPSLRLFEGLGFERISLDGGVAVYERPLTMLEK